MTGNEPTSRCARPAVGYAVLMMTVMAAGFLPAEVQAIYRPDTFPNPQTDPAGCGLGAGMTSWLCDPSGTLTFSQVRDLQTSLVSIRESGRCPCSEDCSIAFTVSIAIVPRLEFSERDRDRRQAVEDFAKHLRDFTWSTHGRCGETIVIVYSVEDQIVWAAAGQRAREEVEDECLDDIRRRAMERFQEGDIYDALEFMINEYKKYLNENLPCTISINSGGFQPLWVVWIFLGVLALGCLTYIIIVCFRRCSDNVTQRPPRYPATLGKKVLPKDPVVSSGVTTITVSNNGPVYDSGPLPRSQVKVLAAPIGVRAVLGSPAGPNLYGSAPTGTTLLQSSISPVGRGRTEYLNSGSLVIPSSLIVASRPAPARVVTTSRPQVAGGGDLVYGGQDGLSGSVVITSEANTTRPVSFTDGTLLERSIGSLGANETIVLPTAGVNVTSFQTS